VTLSFIYELDTYFLQIYRICECELSMSRLSKVIVSDRHTYRHCQTDTTEIIGLYHAFLRVVNNNTMVALVYSFVYDRAC